MTSLKPPSYENQSSQQSTGQRLLVQIPCLNEAESIARVIASIPRRTEHPDVRVEVLVIDDGSSDGTAQIAIDAGADFVISHKYTKGLAEAFKTGQAFALKNGYDILVNTDGDDQYFQDKIPQLIEPILNGRAEIVVGNRMTSNLSHFSWGKKIMQRVGTKALNLAGGTDVPDAASGFRAYSRFALANLFITTKFSYAMETFIQAGVKNLRIESVDTGAKPVHRPSRLFRSSFEHVVKSGLAILRGFIMYKPMRVFMTLSLLLLLTGLAPFVRYLILTIQGNAGDHFQSLLVGAILLIAGAIIGMSGILADMIRVNRLLIEEVLSQSRLGHS